MGTLMIFTIKKPSIGKIMKITSPTINTKIIWEISFSTVEDKTEDTINAGVVTDSNKVVKRLLKSVSSIFIFNKI